MKPHECEISSINMDILKKLHSLPNDSYEEIVHILNYKYDILKKKHLSLQNITQIIS